MQFIYFLPGIQPSDLVTPRARFNPATLRRFGLEEVFADVSGDVTLDTCLDECRGKGPGGRSGVFLGYQTPNGGMPQHFGHYPEVLKWEPLGGGSEAWIGWHPERLPGPDDLARKQSLDGYRPTLADGNRWCIPIVRRPDDSTELPRDMHLDDAGRLVKPVKAAYRRFWEDAGVTCNWFFQPGKTLDEVGFDELLAFKTAVKSLGLNYRYGQAEQRILGLIDTINYIPVILATIDFYRYRDVEAAAKKNASPAGTLTTTPGPAAG